MASKRIVKSAINWIEFKKIVPPTQKAQYMLFKSKCENYMKKMMSYPAKPPKIDWDMYKKLVATAGLVDSFQKSYEALAIPIPRAPDNITKDLDDQEKTVKAEIAVFKKESCRKIDDYKEQLRVLHNLLPYNQMTMEDFKDAHPDIALDPINKPTFWPHNADEQSDYTDKGHPLYGAKPPRG